MSKLFVHTLTVKTIMRRSLYLEYCGIVMVTATMFTPNRVTITLRRFCSAQSKLLYILQEIELYLLEEWIPGSSVTFQVWSNKRGV